MSESASRVLDVAAATTTQSSGTITARRDRRGFILRVNVTAGSTLSLIAALILILPDGNEIPMGNASAALTGIGVANYLFYPATITEPTAVTEAIETPIPVEFKVTITHGNANAATYTVDLVWVT